MSNKKFKKAWIVFSLFIVFCILMGLNNFKHQHNYSTKETLNSLKLETGPVSTRSVTTNLTNCTTNIPVLNSKLTVTSVEYAEKNTIVNVTVQNNYKKEIQLFGSNDIALVDNASNHYNLKPMESYSVYDSIPPGGTTNVRLVFDPIDSNSKTLNLTGDLWTIDGGVMDGKFIISIK